MDITITPGKLSGTVIAPASKSVAHRLLIAAAFADAPSFVSCPCTSDDIDATARCLSALGADIEFAHGEGFSVEPIPEGGRGADKGALLDCGESGSTLRFLVPVAAALGCQARFTGAPRLLERPLGPLVDELARHGVTVTRTGDELAVDGCLEPGRFTIPGNISSQFATGLILAAAVLPGPCEVLVSEPVASRPYIDLTLRALAVYGVEVARDTVERDGRRWSAYLVAPGLNEAPSEHAFVEGDWSAAAFWLCAGAIGNDVTVEGLDLSSVQGDRSVLAMLALLGARVTRGNGRASVTQDRPCPRTLDMEDTPDLVPPVAAVCALTEGGCRLTGTSRLRLKESDRIETVAAALRALGAKVTVHEDDILLEGIDALSGGTVDAANDHRIAMMAAIAATRATGPVTVLGAECVHKSYPAFWEAYRSLGGTFEEVQQ